MELAAVYWLKLRYPKNKARDVKKKILTLYLEWGEIKRQC